MDSQKVEFPRVDLTGLLQVKSDSSCWKMAQEKVISALANYGGFEAVYGDVKPGLKTEFFENIMPKFMSDVSEVSYAQGCPPAVLFQHDLALKNLCINDPTSLSSVEDYVKSIWPKGNDLFCNGICNYAKHIQEVGQIIQRMILMSFNLEEDYESNKFMASSLILIEYVNDKAMDKSRIGMPAHVDANYISIICQHDVEGLEIEGPNNEWICVTPTTNSFTILAGEVLMAWTNGIFQAGKHRVRMDDFTKRYSTVFALFPCHGDDKIQMLDKLIDKNLPMTYQPYNYHDYMDFRIVNGMRANDDLKCYLETKKANPTI